MAITQSLLVANGSTTDQNNYTTASITPTANKLIVAAILSQRNTAGAYVAPTLAGNGLTWVQVNTAVFGSGNTGIAMTAFRAMGASPSSGAVTITHTTTQTLCMWIISEFDGIDTSGTDGSGAVVQSGIANGTGTAGTATLSAFGDAVNNAAYSAISVRTNSSVTEESGYTEISDIGASSTHRSEAMWQIGQDTTPTPTWSSSQGFAQVVAELKDAAAAATVDPYPYIGGGYYPTEG